jgi:hypothetical protein
MTRRLALSLALATLALAAVLVPSASAKVKFFQSPSGNIGCVVGGGLARCDILEHTWPTPPKPEGCPVDYGNGVIVLGGHPGEYTCAGDSVFSPSAPVLGYGEKITKNRFTCTSKTSGMRCANRNSGHGFFLSRQTVRLF